MIRHNNSHRRALEKIANHPEKFGFHNPRSISIETNLYHKDRILAQPDLIIELRNEEIHIVEYKANGDGNGEALERAKKQLEHARWWYGRYKPDVLPERIHTHIISGNDPKYKDLLRGFD